MIKKIIALLLCISVVGILVCGCGNKTTNSDVKPSVPEDTTVETIPTDETMPMDAEPATIASSNTWYQGNTARNSITEIEIVRLYTAKGNETESWAAAVDAKNDGKLDEDIMCYVVDTKLIISGNGAEKIIANKNAAFMFSNVGSNDMFENVTKITGLELLDTSNCETFASMFEGCKALTELNIVSFNTEKVTDMNHMFTKCKSLTTLDLSNFNTANVTNMRNMFEYCTQLVNLNISNFNTAKLDSLDHMFENCESLKSIDISHFDTSNVTSMLSMFSYCTSLEDVNMDNINTSKLLEFSYMFASCSSLTTIKMNKFDTSTIKGMDYCFANCSNLTLDCSNWNVDRVEYHYDFASNAPNIVEPNWKQ